MMPMVGQILYGYCEGYFDSRPFVGARRIEGVGHDWIVARPYKPIESEPGLAIFQSRDEMLKCVAEWSVKPEDFDD